jgi:hypothetical protein
MRKLSIIGILVMLLSGLVMPASAQEEIPASYRLDTARMTPMYQYWNMCGPATLTMALSYFGYPAANQDAQKVAASYLKPDIEDQNVSPWQINDYVNNVIGNQYNLRAVVRRGGDIALLKNLIAHNFPVMIEEGYQPQGYDWMGHYLLMVGYDDPSQTFYTFDSFLGFGESVNGARQGKPYTYDHIVEFWRHFNYAFIVLYQPEREAELQTLMGDYWDEQAAWRIAGEKAALEFQNNAADNWSWFNLAEALNGQGRYAEAVSAYQSAFATRQMPYRTLWYLHGAFESAYQVGAYDLMLEYASIVQQTTAYIEEANYYRGLAYAAQGNTDQALYRLQLALDFNPNFYPAQQVIDAINNGTYAAPSASSAPQPGG